MNAKRLNWFAPSVASLVLLATQPVHASCTSQEICSEGRCTQVPVCDTMPDAPPVHPISRPPVVPPTTKRAPRANCAPRYICTGNICQTQTVCE